MPGHRKRRQFKQTDAFTRGMVIGLKRTGWSIRQIAADTHLGASTVHRLWRRWLEQGNVAIYRNVGATRVTSARVDRRILRQAVAAPQATCTAILQHVQDTLDHSISTRTISRRLVANGLHSCRPLRRLPLTPPNRRQRLEWCRARSTWMTEWHRVVFSDESRFCLSSDSRRVRVWRRRGERSNPAAIVERPTVRQRGIMVWGAIAYDSRSPLLRIQGTMTAQRYVDDVLRPVTLPYLQGVPNALYQQDNARPHTARISQQALQDVQMLPWPPYSPDLSPIEHVWDIIGRRLHALPQPRSEDELWQMVEREWRAIPQDAIRTMIDSLPRRVAACIAVRVEMVGGSKLTVVRKRLMLSIVRLCGRLSQEDKNFNQKTRLAAIEREIGSRVGRNQTTVMRICDRWMQEVTTDRRVRSHAPQCTTSRADRQIVCKAVTDRSVTSQTVAHRVACPQDVLRLPLTQNHRCLRRQWSDERRMWTAEWNEIVFTDESRFCLQHHGGRIRVWRHRGERILNSCVMQRHTGPAPGFMVWGGIGYHSRAPLERIAGTLNSQRYISEDNARPHVARIVQRFFVNCQIELLLWPARSLALSLIENMWSVVAQRLTQITSPAATPDQLWQRVEAAWSAVPQDHIHSIFESMPRRVAAPMLSALWQGHYRRRLRLLPVPSARGLVGLVAAGTCRRLEGAGISGSLPRDGGQRQTASPEIRDRTPLLKKAAALLYPFEKRKGPYVNIHASDGGICFPVDSNPPKVSRWQAQLLQEGAWVVPAKAVKPNFRSSEKTDIGMPCLSTPRKPCQTLAQCSRRMTVLKRRRSDTREEGLEIKSCNFSGEVGDGFCRTRSLGEANAQASPEETSQLSPEMTLPSLSMWVSYLDQEGTVVRVVIIGGLVLGRRQLQKADGSRIRSDGDTLVYSCAAYRLSRLVQGHSIGLLNEKDINFMLSEKTAKLNSPANRCDAARFQGRNSEVHLGCRTEILARESFLSRMLLVFPVRAISSLAKFPIAIFCSALNWAEKPVHLLVVRRRLDEILSL
ncbi:hypothetical protein LAZ67_13001425 [Cordylochernes scorpioides]|uniref:Transposase n=1 Tax=Cordylochernes scorpioides TaxID=51811 RepID=A0ABY6L6H7_9ARAC|nr:hypothetical protein LAZ67_13001425 [Cordylochernes scorpioides]